MSFITAFSSLHTQRESLGTYRLTAYCSCEKCCGVWAKNRPNGEVRGASGELLTAGYSIAVDPNVIPYGTEVIINGHTYKAQDCGGAIKNKRIDVYFDSHEEALQFGVQYAEVFTKEKKQKMTLTIADYLFFYEKLGMYLEINDGEIVHFDFEEGN